jgi:hypothetical protein
MPLLSGAVTPPPEQEDHREHRDPDGEKECRHTDDGSGTTDSRSPSLSSTP